MIEFNPFASPYSPAAAPVSTSVPASTPSAMAPVTLPPLRAMPTANPTSPTPPPPPRQLMDANHTMSMLKAVEDCVKNVSEARSLANLSSVDQLQICIEMQGLSKNVLSVLQSLSPITRSMYPLDTYLVPYLDSQLQQCSFDGNFYGIWLELMRVVLGVPKSMLTVIEIGNITSAPAQQELLNTLRGIRGDETVLFINSNIHTFCVCSPRMGMVEIDSPHSVQHGTFCQIFDLLLTGNRPNDNHFREVYAVWRERGVYDQCIPSKISKEKQKTWDPSQSKSYWVNGFIAFLYVTLDVCRVNLMVATHRYLHNLIHIELDAWDNTLPVRVLYYFLSALAVMQPGYNAYALP